MRKDDFRDFVLEQLSGLRALDCRAVFSGYGFWCDKTFFAIVSKGKLYFRANDETRPDFKSTGSGPLLTRGGRPEPNFLQVPDDVVKDANRLLAWAVKSIEGAREERQPRRKKVRLK